MLQNGRNNMDKYYEEITAKETQIKELENQFKKEVEETKPLLKLKFLTNRELINHNDPLQAKVSQDTIKEELKELNKLVNILWQ